MSMGGHQSSGMKTDEWLTPPEIINALGPFDLDPCASIIRPWPTAMNHYTIQDNGLIQEWKGRVWCNPPYGLVASKWLERLANHGNGIALIFARTETTMFFVHVWNRAQAILFINGRLSFYDINGIRATANGGAPSCLVAYGVNNVKILEQSGIKGKLIRL